MEKRIVNQPENVDGYRVVQEGEDVYKALKEGEIVMHWEAGNSMYPLLKHMEYCKIIPLGETVLNKEFVIGKPVFCHFVYPDGDKLIDVYMVHRWTEIYERDGELYFRIEGTDGTHFGWTKDVYGIAESTNVFEDVRSLYS